MRLPRALLLSAALAVAACKGQVGDLTDGGDPGGADASTVPPDPSGCAVQALLQARCTSCHGAPLAGGAPVSFASLDTLRTPSARDPNQTYAERCVARMQDDGAPMPSGGAPRATPDEIAVISSWIAGGMPACDTPSDGGTVALSPNLIPQSELFACSGAVSDAPTRLRRLNRWEWTRNVGGAVTRDWTGFSFFDNPLDPSAGEPYSTYATNETVDEATIELLLPVLGAAGPPWAGPYAGDNRLERLQFDDSLRCMYEDDHPTADCIRHYLSEFLLHGVLFRPATTAELDHLQSFATTALAEEGDAGTTLRTETITRISNAAWMTTGALFRSEQGDPNATGRTELTNWQLAQQFAYAIAARAPGATPTWAYPYFSAPMEGHLADIAGAAEDGGIRNAATVEALIREYAGGTDTTRFDLVQDYSDQWRSRRGQYWLADGAANFFRQWLGYTKVPEIFKEWPEHTSAYDDGNTDGYRAQLASYDQQMNGYYGYESTLVQQMDDAVARVVVADQNVLKNLLTTRTWYLPSTANPSSYANSILYTGQMYGTEQSIADSQDARWITFPADERAGVLTHPAWLGSHGGNFEDDPSIVHRGKWIRENLLCGYVPPLSQVKVMAVVGPHAPNKNARARLEEATASTTCQSCHALMNPLGYPFEIYNHAGYLRVVDHAADGGWGSPNGSATLTGLPDPELNGTVRDAVDFSERLAASPYVKRCFIRQAFRYYMGRDENRTDACTLASMEQAYDQSGGSFFKMITALMTSDTWKSRRVPGGGE